MAAPIPAPTLPRRRAARLLAAAVLLLLAVPAARAQLAGQEVRGFTLPEYDEDGNLRQELYGETATLLDGGLMQLSGLRIEFFDQGRLAARVRAPECALDQLAKRAASRSHIRIVTDKGVLSGDGFAWNGENEQFQIFQNVRVVLDATDPDLARQLGGTVPDVGGAPAPEPPAKEPSAP